MIVTLDQQYNYVLLSFDSVPKKGQNSELSCEVSDICVTAILQTTVCLNVYPECLICHTH